MLTVNNISNGVHAFSGALKAEVNGAGITITGDVKAEELESIMKECLL